MRLIAKFEQALGMLALSMFLVLAYASLCYVNGYHTWSACEIGQLFNVTPQDLDRRLP